MGLLGIYIYTGWTGNYLHSGKIFSTRVPGGVLKTGQLLSHWTVTSVTVTCLLDLSDSCDMSLRPLETSRWTVTGVRPSRQDIS